MLGAIKRRWKSKKAKVLHKGAELPSSHDSCPASRGFVDEDFEKIIKPPSPRQIHPVLETSMEVVSSKYSNSQHAHHNCITSGKAGNTGNAGIVNTSKNSKSSTLPSGPAEPCPFIRVNSGRIELVNSSPSRENRHGSGPHYHLPHPPFPEILSEKLRRRLGGRLRNDSRHSWCGGSGGSRDGPRMRGSSGLVLSAAQPPSSQGQETVRPEFPPNEKRLIQPPEVDPTYSDPIEENQIIRLRTSLLQERLDVLETLTKNCQNWQKEDKKETEAWITDLTSQVTRALTFQQVMKSEVEKLQERVLDLETHNRAMATMIVPTLMKLQETIGKTRAEVRRGSGSEIPRSSEQIKIKGKGMTESWSPTSTTTMSPTTMSPAMVMASPQSLKEKKIDCRIPRIRASRTKHQEQRSGGESSSSPDLTPPNSRIPTNGNTALPATVIPRRLLPSKAMPKSKSSLTANMHSKIPGSNPQNKSSTFSGTFSGTCSGIPRMSSPRPVPVEATTGERTGSGSNGGGVKTSSPSGNGGSSNGSSSGGVGSRNGAGNHKNEPPKTPCHDLHNNSSGSVSANSGGGSRLPIFRGKTVFSNQNPKSSKTNPSKVTSVIHHQNPGKSATSTGFGLSTGNNKDPISGSGSISIIPGSTVTVKPLGKDEGYSTMSSEALAEQEGSSKTLVPTTATAGNDVNDKDISTTTIPKSNTFSTFYHHNLLPPGSADSKPLSSGGGGGPLPKQLIIMGRERNWTSLPKSAIPGIGTTVTSSPSSGVRIVRGISTAMEDGGERLMTMEEPSSTILWEDSDDSDILFLPLEMSTESPGSSSPTLVPPSWSSSATPRLPSSTSFTNSSTVTTPIGTSHLNGNSTQAGDSHPWVSNGSRTPWISPPDPDEEVQGEERALIEKWMRLEDGRNQVHWEDEWAWDWDGVERVHVNKIKKFNPDLRLPEFWNYTENSNFENPPEISSPGKLIDTNTWTKKKSSIPVSKSKPSKNNDGFLVQKQLISSTGTEVLSSEAELTQNKPEGTEPSEPTAPPSVPPSPPPAIEFTPAYYHLVKYGSSSSVNDTQQLKFSPAKLKPKEFKTEFVSFSSSDEEGCGKMDDKISQTDFGSSLENLSVSSELFTECRNCLELIKRLVGGIDEACGVGSSPTGSGERLPVLQSDTGGDSDSTLMTTLDRDRDNRRDETLVTDNGAPTTWISVPKGLPSNEVDRILEILSSSESEDVLSPQSFNPET